MTRKFPTPSGRIISITTGEKQDLIPPEAGYKRLLEGDEFVVDIDTTPLSTLEQVTTPVTPNEQTVTKVEVQKALNKTKK